MRKQWILVLVALFLATAFVYADGPNPAKKWTVIRGEITDIIAADEQIIVDGVTVQVTEDTVIMENKVEITFADLEIGMTVKVRGVYDNDVLVAKKINVMGDCARIEGEIDSIDYTLEEFVVGTVTVQITEDTVITKKHVPITFADLEVGMTVCACGELVGDVLTATKINVKTCCE